LLDIHPLRFLHISCAADSGVSSIRIFFFPLSEGRKKQPRIFSR